MGFLAGKGKQAAVGLLAAVLAALVAGGLWYWYDSNVDRSGWVDWNGLRIYQDFHGDPASGWLTLGEERFYLSPDGVPQTGWQDIQGETYHFDKTGLLSTGWLEEEGVWRYLDPQMVTGWQEIEGERYFFREDGAMAQGLLSTPEGTYYLPQGHLATGWQTIDGKLHFFSPDGLQATGWQQIGGEVYYFETTGTLVTGLAQVDGESYRFQEDGRLLTGWQGLRCYQSNGLPMSGWQEIAGKLYHFDETGLAQTGWFYQGEYRWYFQADGSAAVGPVVVDGIQRYFSPKGMEVVLVNAKNPIPEDYAPDLVRINSRHQVAFPCYEALMAMMADCEAQGIEFEFNSSYRTQETQEAILEEYTADYMQYRDLTYQEARAQALEFVAHPGTSEHQLGLAVDLVGEEAEAWFNLHCWDYGFIRRYPEDKVAYTGIISEPWHFRYVGREIAQDLKNSGLCLEEYLGAQSVK